ncbi:MAG: flagellar biosynthesis anti-sigma factor FlgM [Polaromonas sp.]|jgi:negative regulator of flagellin synthesis FlgM|nr:flagellar biosynthesis anti-sigma factor FlgM [Polaromonas sp.]
MKIDSSLTYPKNLSSPSGVAPGGDGLNVARASPKTPVAENTSTIDMTPTQFPSTKSDFDATRVAAIRASISAGHYTVNTAKIADGLLVVVRDLLNGKDS